MIETPFLESPWAAGSQTVTDAITELRLRTIELAMERARLAQTLGPSGEEAERKELDEARAIAKRWADENGGTL